MAYETPTREPEVFTQGDKVSWKITLSDFPATLWTLSYDFVQSSDQQATTASASGTDHLVVITAAESAVFNTGDYHYQAHVTQIADSTVRYTLDREQGLPMHCGRLEVKADYATNTTGYDARSDAEKALDDAISAHSDYMSSRATVASYSIGDRSISFNSISEIEAEIRRLEAIVAKEKAAERLKKGLGHPGNVKIRIRDAS